MTRQEAKEIALKHCSPLKAFTFDPLTVAAQSIQAHHVMLSEQRITALLHDIMESTVGIPARIMRVHDEIIVETEHSPSRVELQAICTKYGIEVQQPRSTPLVESV